MELISGIGIGIAICSGLAFVFREALLKRYQHSLDQKLLQFKNDIDTAISDVSVSGNMLANIRTIRKPHEIAALKSMWESIEEMDAQFGDVFAYEDVFTPEQLDRIIQSQGRGSIEDETVFTEMFSFGERFEKSWGKDEGSNKVVDLKDMLFVDVELWAWWALIRKMYIRFGSLFLSCVPNGHYPRWQEDHLLQDFCHTALSNGWIKDRDLEEAQKPDGGLWHILLILRTSFAQKAQEAILGQGRLDELDSRVAASEPDRFREFYEFLKKN